MYIFKILHIFNSQRTHQRQAHWVSEQKHFQMNSNISNEKSFSTISQSISEKSLPLPPLNCH